MILGETENIFITGSVDALKTWSPDNAIGLSAATYPIWSGEQLDPCPSPFFDRADPL